MKRALTIALAFIVGTVVGYAICLGLYIVYTEIVDFSDREGATSMAVAFFIAPVVAVISGLASTIWAAWWTRRPSA